MIENAAKGENWMFRNFFAEMDGKEKDILRDGGLSCAAFASSVLYLNKFIKDVHANTRSVEKDLLVSGWEEIKELKLGAVLVWEVQDYPHIGFYIGDEMAISNDSKGRGFPHKHHYTYNDTRKIEKIYWHSSLDE